MKYFAYGSNMKHKQMAERCPDASFLAKGYIENYTVMYDGYSKRWNGSGANIVTSESDIVWGGLYDLGEKDIASLDIFENTYEKKFVEAVDHHGSVHKTVTYFRTGYPEGELSGKYILTVVEGARHCDLPGDYIKILSLGRQTLSS